METKAELEQLVSLAIQQVNQGSVSLDDILKTLAPTKPGADEVAERLPVPLAITDRQKEALVKVAEVFGKISPTERRALTPEEVDGLVEEKQLLDELKKMADSRLDEGIKVAVHNHLDVEAESQGITKDAGKNKDGHWVIAGEVRGQPDTPHRFTREVREGSPSIDTARLQELANDPEVDFIDHQDWLSITTPVRVLDESKLVLALRKKPGLILALSEAAKPGTKTVSINLRKA